LDVSPAVGIVGFGFVREIAHVLREILDGGLNWELVVSCITAHDAVDRRTRERLQRVSNGPPDLLHISFPIFDRDIPSQLTATLLLVRALSERRRLGERLLIGCGAGCGRSGMLAATVLVADGMPPVDAFARVERKRLETLRPYLRVTEAIIEEPTQRAFVDLFARAWPVATGASDLSPLLAPMSLGVGAVSLAELHGVRADLEANATYETAIVALATLGAANASPRYDDALLEIGRLLSLPSATSHTPTVDFSVGRTAVPVAVSTRLLSVFDGVLAELVGTIDRSGKSVLPYYGQPVTEAAPARADSEPPAQAAAEDTGPEGAQASSGMARQPAPSSPADATVRVDIKLDEKFEEYLAAEVAKLPEENRKPTVVRLARLRFYGLASKFLYPEYENTPPDLHPPRDGYARPLFHAVDRAAARTICRNFINAHRERFDYYRRLDL